MKRTKIICTIGPASDNEEMMTKLAQGNEHDKAELFTWYIR